MSCKSNILFARITAGTNSDPDFLPRRQTNFGLSCQVRLTHRGPEDQIEVETGAKAQGVSFSNTVGLNPLPGDLLTVVDQHINILLKTHGLYDQILVRTSVIEQDTPFTGSFFIYPSPTKQPI